MNDDKTLVTEVVNELEAKMAGAPAPKAKRSALVKRPEAAKEGAKPAGNVSSSGQEDSTTMDDDDNETEPSVTYAELNDAMTGLLDYLKASPVDAHRKAADSGDAEKIAKVFPALFKNWQKAAKEKEARLSTFRAGLVAVAHQVFDAAETNLMPLGALVMAVRSQLPFELGEVGDFRIAAKAVLEADDSVSPPFGVSEDGTKVLRWLKSDGTATNATWPLDPAALALTAPLAPKRRGRKPGSKNKPKTEAEAAPKPGLGRPKKASDGKPKKAGAQKQGPNETKKSPAAAKVRDMLGWKRGLTVAEWAKLMAKLPEGLNTAKASKAQIKDAATAASLKE